MEIALKLEYNRLDRLKVPYFTIHKKIIGRYSKAILYCR